MNSTGESRFSVEGVSAVRSETSSSPRSPRPLQMLKRLLDPASQPFLLHPLLKPLPRERTPHHHHRLIPNSPLSQPPPSPPPPLSPHPPLLPCPTVSLPPLLTTSQHPLSNLSPSLNPSPQPPATPRPSHPPPSLLRPAQSPTPSPRLPRDDEIISSSTSRESRPKTLWTMLLGI